MTQSVHLSVAIILYKSDRRVFDCLESLCFQEQAPSFEVQIVNNHPVPLREEFKSKVEKMFSKIKLRIHEFGSDNIGAARAFALSAAESDFVAFTDPDCILPKLWLRNLYDSFLEKRKDPVVAGLGGANVPMTEKKSDQLFLKFIHNCNFANLNSPQGFLGDREKEVDHLPTMNAIFYRPLVLSVGNFSEEFKKVGEDLHLGWKLQARGLKLIWRPQPSVTHQFNFSLKNWLHRMFRFGSAQSQAMLSSSVMPFRHKVALLLLFVFLTITVFSSLALEFLTLFMILYFCVCTALILFQLKTIIFLPQILVQTFLTHLSYGTGMVFGFIHYFRMTRLELPRVRVNKT